MCLCANQLHHMNVSASCKVDGPVQLSFLLKMIRIIQFYWPVVKDDTNLVFKPLLFLHTWPRVALLRFTFALGLLGVLVNINF